MQTSLTSLDLRMCRGSEFQSSLEDLLTRNNTSLTNLCVASCDEFVCLPDNLVALEGLYIRDCKNLTDIKHCLPSARIVDISGCSKLIGLPSLSQVFPVMEHFVLEKCNEIVALPDIRSHTCLQVLRIWKLEKLTSVPELCKSLRRLILFGCDSLVSFPDFRYLRSLNLHYTYYDTKERGPSHLSLPFFSEFQCLQSLEFGGLPELKSLPEQIQHLTALTVLYLLNLDGLESLPDWLGNIISLETLEIASCTKLKYLPEQIQHLTALKTLNLRRLDGLESLPDGLGNLISLETLRIERCKKLKCFPSVEAMRRLINLKVLEIRGCPLLEKGFTKRFRSEWRKISHIPRIEFNRNVISGVDDIKVSEVDE